jgi:outer membrane biosynthesis protein TonB
MPRLLSATRRSKLLSLALVTPALLLASMLTACGSSDADLSEKLARAESAALRAEAAQKAAESAAGTARAKAREMSAPQEEEPDQPEERQEDTSEEPSGDEPDNAGEPEA